MQLCRGHHESVEIFATNTHILTFTTIANKICQVDTKASKAMLRWSVEVLQIFHLLRYTFVAAFLKESVKVAAL